MKCKFDGHVFMAVHISLTKRSCKAGHVLYKKRPLGGDVSHTFLPPQHTTSMELWFQINGCLPRDGRQRRQERVCVFNIVLIKVFFFIKITICCVPAQLFFLNIFLECSYLWQPIWHPTQNDPWTQCELLVSNTVSRMLLYFGVLFGSIKH